MSIEFKKSSLAHSEQLLSTILLLYSLNSESIRNRLTQPQNASESIVLLHVLQYVSVIVIVCPVFVLLFSAN